MIKTVKVKEILLGPKYNENDTNIDLTNYLFSDIFQARIRRQKHKEKDYICSYCSGTGVVLTITNKQNPYSTTEELLKDLSLFTTYESSAVVEEVINDLGLPYKASDKSKSDSTIVNNWLTKFYQAKKIIYDNYKILEDINSDEVVLKGSNDKKRLLALKKMGLKIKNAIRTNGRNPLLVPCAVCGGNGYYDVSSSNLFGKQVELMNMVYKKYVAKNPSKKAWETRIRVSTLWKWFQTLTMRPSIPNVLNEFVDPDPLINKKISRWNKYRQQNKDAKTKLYKYYEDLYLGNTTGSISSEVTYDEILNFFKQFAASARLKTGTLHRSLLDEYDNLKAAQKTQYLQWSDKLDNISQTPYIGKYLFIEGPISQKAKRYKNTGSMGALFVYGARFVPSSLPGGYGHLPWSKNGSSGVTQMIQSNFKNSNLLLQKKFFMFFPQRVTQWQIV